MAKVVTPSAEEWAVIGPFLAEIREGGGGAIVVPPSVSESLRSKGYTVSDPVIPGYNFGGEADIVIDVVGDLMGHHTPGEVRQMHEDGDLGIPECALAEAAGVV